MEIFKIGEPVGLRINKSVHESLMKHTFDVVEYNAYGQVTIFAYNEIYRCFRQVQREISTSMYATISNSVI
jgi:hypothetical protein